VIRSPRDCRLRIGHDVNRLSRWNDRGKSKLQMPLLQVSLPAATVFYWICDFEARLSPRRHGQQECD
jgi:hypothetical protein